mgnify:CR=1 FL=1
MVELIKHTLGICGEHWHPNAFTMIASFPMVAFTVNYIKCKCGGWFTHKKNCKKK